MSLERILTLLKTAADVIGWLRDLLYDALGALKLRQS